MRMSSATGAARVLTITGIFDLGSKGANQRNTYVALRTAQALPGLVGGVTDHRPDGRRHLCRRNHRAGDPAATGVEADSWIKTNAQFFTAVSAQESPTP